MNSMHPSYILLDLILTLVIWAIEGYLGLLVLRYVLRWIPSVSLTPWYASMVELTDALPRYCDTWIQNRWPRDDWDPRMSRLFVLLVLIVIHLILATFLGGGIA